MDFTLYILLTLAEFCIIRGIAILISKEVPRSEEKVISEYPEKGIKRYTYLLAGFNIFSGLFLNALFVMRVGNLVDMNIYRFIGIGGLALIFTAFLAIRKSCKKAF